MVRSLLRVVLVASLLVGGARSAAAHTYAEQQATCPVCKYRFEVRVTASMTTFGAYLDFQKKGAIGSYYADLVHQCPTCHFAGYLSDFQRKVSDAVRKRVLAELRPRKGPFSQAQECEAAAQVYSWEGKKSEALGDLYLVASYLLRGKKGGEEAERKRYQGLAAGHFAKAYEKDELAKNVRAPVAYLVGELHRRCGRFDEALRWYERALKEKERPEWLAKQTAEQQKLARKRDANNDI
jgi:uncharacterized protein (DUF2225 family)